MIHGDEQRLLRRYRETRDQATRDAVIERFLPLARSLARRYRGSDDLLEDREQVACLALVKAVDAYDPDRGAAFTSYAVPCIAGAIKRHYRDYGWAVRVPRDLQELALRAERVSDELLTETGEPPTAAAVADAAGVSVDAVLEARQAFRALHSDSLDQPQRARDEEDGASLLETIGDSDPGYDEVVDRSTLDAVLESLDDPAAREPLLPVRAHPGADRAPDGLLPDARVALAAPGRRPSPPRGRSAHT